MADFSKIGKDRPFIKPDQLQKELVQAKIEEMKRAKNGGGVKKRKSDNEINKIGRSTSPSKDERPAYKSGYNTWNVHDASNMREKSKQFFKNETNNGLSGQDSARSSIRSVNLQRQSSLPPRTKKESLEIQRIMPRAPSGPMYRSPEQKPRALSRGSDTTNYVHTRSSSSDAAGHNYVRNSSSTPSSTTKSNKDKKQNDTPLSSNRLKKPEDGEIRYSSISDITRSGGSVKISHKAEI